MPETPLAFRRSHLVLMGCGLAFGALCFFAGRFTAPHPAAPSAADRADRFLEPTAAPTAEPAKAITPAQPQDSPASPGHWSDERWQKAHSSPASPHRNAVLTQLLLQLATTDPDRAMALAKAEGNLKLRENLVQAALQGWARTAPTNAANWALALTDSSEREHALALVFAGAVAADPDAAVQLGKSIVQEHLDDGLEYGNSLIDALCNNGHFESAALLAASGGQGLRSGWMATAYSRWAEYQPDQAAKAAAAIEDRDTRNEALHGIVGGWAETDPAALIQFVTKLPADPERGSLLSQALERWVRHDPEAASAWINKNENDASPDLDQGVAAVASLDSVKPDVAAGWAESVVDPKLRSETLVTVLRNWLTADLPAARHYFDTTRNLLPEDREELNGVFAGFNHDSSGQ